MASPSDDAAEHDFELVVSGHQRRLGQFLVQIVGSGQLAEDLLQETFLVAFREREQLTHVENVTAWLFAIARHRALDALRRRRRGEAALRRLIALVREPAGDPSDAVAARQLLERHLDADERTLLILRYLHGFDSAELAVIVDSSPEAVRQRLSRTRRRLLAALGETVEPQQAPSAAGLPSRPAPPSVAEYRADDRLLAEDGPVAEAEHRRLVSLLAPLAGAEPPRIHRSTEARREPR
jgi:RNA polymerase sigma-70 factor (ECF subfamily)